MCVDELTWCCHAAGHPRHAHGHRLQTTEALGHAGGKVSILGVGGCFFEGSEAVFSFVIFFLAAVAAIRTFRAITAIVCSTMSKVEG